MLEELRVKYTQALQATWTFTEGGYANGKVIGKSARTGEQILVDKRVYKFRATPMFSGRFCSKCQLKLSGNSIEVETPAIVKDLNKRARAARKYGKAEFDAVFCSYHKANVAAGIYSQMANLSIS